MGGDDYNLPSLFLRSLTGRCYCNQLILVIIAKMTSTTFIVCTGVRQLIDDVRFNSEDDAATSCRNWLSFGQVNLVCTRVEILAFGTIFGKLAYANNYLGMHWADRRYFFTFW